MGRYTQIYYKIVCKILLYLIPQFVMWENTWTIILQSRLEKRSGNTVKRKATALMMYL